MSRSNAQLWAGRERAVSELAREAEDGFNRNDLRPAYRAIKRLSSVPAPAASTLLRDDGTVVMGHEGCRERLAEYFEELYNVPPLAGRLAGGGLAIVVAPDTPIREDPPYFLDVENVVSEQKN